MNALQALKYELRRIQKAQAKLVDDNGVVFNYAKYKYKLLAEEADFVKRSLEWFEKLR